MTTPSERSAAEPAGSAEPGAATSRWLVFGIVSVALFMSSVDTTIVSTGLETIREALHTRINWATWTVTGYELGLVVSMPISGRISDQLGRKRVFLIAACVFIISSLLCGLSDSVGLLITLRVVQAVGGGAFMPSASGMIVDIFGEQRSRALGLFSSIFPLGALVGPVLGGILIAEWSWRGIFFVNVPVGLVFLVLAAKYLPSSAPRGGGADVVGAVLLGGGVLGTMLAISHLGDAGASVASVAFAVPLGAALACGAAFLWRSGRLAEPLIPLHLLRGRMFAAMNVINFIWGSCAIGFSALVPLFAQDRYGLTPLASGTLLTARAVGEIGLAFLASMLIHRTGYRAPMVVGFLFIATGVVLLGVHPQLLDPYGWLAFAAALTGVGIGISAPGANNATIEFSPDDVGAISGLRGATRQGGAIIGVAVASSVVARSSDEAVALGHAFMVLGVLVALLVPLVFVVPDGRRVRARPPRRFAAADRPDTSLAD